MSDQPHAPDPQLVKTLFSRIAPSYDFVNKVLSLGHDQAWRNYAARTIPAHPNNQVLDLCGGSGMFLKAMLAYHPQVRGTVIDFATPMLKLAQANLKPRTQSATFIEADCLHLPLATCCADVVLLGFGLRNLANWQQGVLEIRRVLNPQGLLAILEFTPDTDTLFHPFYRWYFQTILPRIGGWLSGDLQAYRYLPDSLKTFPTRAKIQQVLLASGFSKVNMTRLTQGICTFFLAQADETLPDAIQKK